MPVTPEYNRSVSSALKNTPSGRVLFQTSFKERIHINIGQLMRKLWEIRTHH